MESTITKRASIQYLNAMVYFVSDFLRENNVKQEIISEAHLVVEEVLVNVCTYAYPKGRKGQVTVKCKLSTDKDMAIITLIDSGVAFDTALASLPSLTLPISSRSVGGLGIHMVRRLMDKVLYSRENGKNILILEKRVSS